MSDPNITDWIAAVAGSFAALATAGAAVASLISARASERTSREARDALTAAIEPAISVEVVEDYPDISEPEGTPARMLLRVTNLARLAATNLEAVAMFTDGHLVRDRRELLDPFAADDDWFIRLREVTPEWPPKDTVEPIEIVVRFSDSRSLGRYEQATVAALLQVRDDTGVQAEIQPVRKRRIT